MIKPSIFSVVWPLFTLPLQGKSGDALPNITTLDLTQVAT